jgi:hypothetical protein
LTTFNAQLGERFSTTEDRERPADRQQPAAAAQRATNPLRRA